MKFSSIIKDTFMLFIITFVLVLVLAVAKVGTQNAIDATNLAAAMKAYSEVCPGYADSVNITTDVVGANAGYDATLTDDESVLRCVNSDGNVIGYIVKTTSKGFGGDLNLIVGFDTDGNIKGVRYANTPSETPGLGMKTTEDWFLNSWIDHNSDTANSVDTISGATVSSSAFKRAILLACTMANRAVTLTSNGGI